MTITNKSLNTFFLVATLSVTAFVTGCSSKSQGAFGKSIPNSVIVKRGDTLAKISNRYGLSWREVAKYNRISSPNHIQVGQRIRLPGGKRSRVTPTQKWSKRNAKTTTYQNWKKTSAPTYAIQSANSNWVKPSQGTLISAFNESQGVKGVRYAGSKGDRVVASQNGQVIYANNGLVEYGNLVLIRHANNYITAYAHLNQFSVKEGDRVKAGEKIGTMGSTGTNQVMLEFQVRRGGNLIDPLRVLKK